MPIAWHAATGPSMGYRPHLPRGRLEPRSPRPSDGGPWRTGSRPRSELPTMLVVRPHANGASTRWLSCPPAGRVRPSTSLPKDVMTHRTLSRPSPQPPRNGLGRRPDPAPPAAPPTHITPAIPHHRPPPPP